MDETSMASSSNQRVFGQGGIGPTVINNMNSTNNFQYNFGEGVAAAAPAHTPPPPIRFTNNENEVDFESRKPVFNDIMAAIKDDGVKMIGIWGMAGIGKTTLVKRVAQYAKDEGLFEVVVMADVSQKCNVKTIQDRIADMIDLNFTYQSDEGRARQLHQRLLAREKILVILDDIWDSSLVLNDIGIPSGSQHKGCKIILTSRIRDVCEQMGTGKIFKIDLLSADEAIVLFLQKSAVGDRSSHKGVLAKDLSEECGRLPICIVIVAKMLLNKQLFYWNDMLNRLRNSDPESKVRDTIELSYNNLEREEEKMFFLLCALFPEDYEIPIQWLFQYGVGLNLFEKVNNLDQAQERARKLASSLISSCLLLDGQRLLLDGERDEEYEELVKMHDVVRDVALAIASQGKNAFLVSPAVAQWREWQDETAISLWNDDTINKLPDALECPRLQILILRCRKPNWHLPDSFFTGMKTLIVLDMEGMKCVRLPQSFAGLKNLRTLCFERCILEDISTIGKLQNLVLLSFKDSDIEVLPKEVGELSKLRLLDLTGCERLKVVIPGMIQNLSRLEVLLMRRFMNWPTDLEDWEPENIVFSELIYLPRLTILEIHIHDESMLPDEVLLQKLTKFKISIGHANLRNGMYLSGSQLLKLTSISENELTKDEIKTLIEKAQGLELKDAKYIICCPSFSATTTCHQSSIVERDMAP